MGNIKFMENNPLVSIIIPTYNVETYISETIECVLNQTFNDWELVITDDCSTDTTVDIIKKYINTDSRIRLSVLPNNSGAAKARNNSIEKAKGRYIAFLDSDDYYELDTLEIAYSAMIENNVDFVCWNICKTWENGEQKEEKLELKGRLKIDEKIIRKTPVMAWNKLFKTSIIKEKTCIFPNGLNFEDNVFWLMYAPWTEFGYYIQKPLYNYLQRQGSIVSNSKKDFRYLPIIPVIFNYYKSYGIEKKYKKLLKQRFEYYFQADIESVFNG